ncbi:hypothetical protein [Xanthomonas sp. NCPPB 2632]|uniref:hypothetical protein n=1 Tax=Xanthomonas sp. NCPPB 2632 TaxID=3240912 RepID=UPI00351339A5
MTNLVHDIDSLIIETQRAERDAAFAGVPATRLDRSAIHRLPPKQRAWFEKLLGEAAMVAFEREQETLWTRVHPLCRRARRRVLLMQLTGVFRRGK